MAYVLAKNGHDVWLGNSRGNLYSNSHKHGCRDATFWDFCIDHFAIFDFPAAIEYVTLHTQSSKVAYIGFSQVSTVSSIRELKKLVWRDLLITRSQFSHFFR